MRILRMKVYQNIMLRRLLSLPRDAAYLLLTHRVRCCILLTHTLTHGSCISVMSDVKVREERVNATLGVNTQFLSRASLYITRFFAAPAGSHFTYSYYAIIKRLHKMLAACASEPSSTAALAQLLPKCQQLLHARDVAPHLLSRGTLTTREYEELGLGVGVQLYSQAAMAERLVMLLLKKPGGGAEQLLWALEKTLEGDSPQTSHRELADMLRKCSQQERDGGQQHVLQHTTVHVC